MAAWTTTLLPTAQDLGPFESFFESRGPQGELTSGPYLAPTLKAVLEADEEMQQRATTRRSRPRTMSETSRTTNFAPADVQGSTVICLGAALAAALFL